jgi:uncharacterized protein YndB with AHSA1/START domain
MIIVETLVNKNIQTVWECWTMPDHIVNWNFASDYWHAPAAKNDLNVGGKIYIHHGSQRRKYAIRI